MLTDSGRAAGEPNPCGPRRPRSPAAFERSAPFGPEPHPAHEETRQLCWAATEAAHPFVQISPPDAVSRRGVSWTGMASEIVQANRRGRIPFHFRAPVHMLAMYERSVRYEGRTLIQGLPPSSLRDCSRKLVFVPAGPESQDWQKRASPRRGAFFFSTPAH